MASIQFLREADRPSTDAPAPRGAIDVTPMLGRWVNTNPDSGGITELIIARDGDGITLRAFGSESPSPIDWGEVRVESVFAGGPGARVIVGAVAHYDFGFMESTLELNLNQGLLIAAGFSTFKDGSGRSNYFFREFYYR